MKVKHRNADIPVSMLYPHPANPRKDVGDVTELAESIKANGIFQNLTVVVGGDGVEAASPEEDIDGYTVIIGHRRLEAAKQAGLTTVPCMVVEMSREEQISTMLLENMQRSDLTIYEQAQGFQMMLDLGETQDSIAEKTGFSKTTIRHRIKLLELDPEELRKAQQRQATMSDYIELEKISDPELKNKALSKIGTSDYNWELKQAIRKDGIIKNEQMMRRYLDRYSAIEIAEGHYYEYKQLHCLKLDATDIGLTEAGIKADFMKYGQLRFRISCNWLYIYGPEIEKEVKAETEPKVPQWKIDAQRREDKKTRIKEVERAARELRLDFVKKFNGSKRVSTMLDMLIRDCTELPDTDWQRVADLCGFDIEDDDVDLFVEADEYNFLLPIHPDKIMLAILADSFENHYGSSLYNYQGAYERNERLEGWYQLLTELGYGISEEEKKLLNGTHDCFKEENNEDQ